MFNQKKSLSGRKYQKSKRSPIRIVNLKRTLLSFLVIVALIFSGTAPLIYRSTSKKVTDAKSSNYMNCVAKNTEINSSNLEDLKVKSGILLEETSGQILYEKNSHERFPMASITKVMTMLLICEAIESGKLNKDDIIIASEHAHKMGGAQIFLANGERMSAYDMLKGVAIVSANDAAVALAEHISGSEESFVGMMNEKANQLGMNDTHFVTCAGLDADNHYSSAYDISIMSRELMKHDLIKPLLTTWMDSLRDGKFTLANTNKLIRFYEGATGIKTGSTSKAGYCLSASATRNGLSLVSVVMGAETTSLRFESSKKLLDYGFSNYAALDENTASSDAYKIRVIKGEVPEINLKPSNQSSKLIPKDKKNTIKKEMNLDESIKAPIKAGHKVGEVIYKSGTEELCRVDLVANEDVKRISFGNAIIHTLKEWMNQK